ncbi:MAG: hydrogenase maturation protease [Candidatus Aminicenantes bacterium]|nr:hydrogenase maturation protease [Candidatus Aminicenantes bacterium]NIM78095.1 hydrogenase maturation protease [Candidatus Aminicenantes bacterium]NIN17413.1 hydrogenase maturation protease [Candidatus Aminicenantes bacterium]NIN41309.1 hydrogenase maturation protease [Candidatus Aminicenantes bacterium]NIN84079.1 hydrogenase maturation protease [Candidatus Aminicenantes bacterium]
MNNNKKKLILGLGNDILMDDGVGPRVVRKLEEKYPLPGTEYRTASLGGMDIVELISGYEWVVFIDAIKTKNGIPGTVYEFTTADFKETLHLTTIHDISFLSAIQLEKQLGLHIPKDIHVFAIEIIEDQVFGENFSPPLQERFDQIVEEIHTKIQSLIG